MKIPGMKNGKASMRWKWQNERLVLVAGDNHWMAYIEECGGINEQNKGKCVAFIGAGDLHGKIFDTVQQAKEWIEKEIGMHN